jgi:LasA protease
MTKVNMLIAFALAASCTKTIASEPLLTEKELIYTNEQMLGFSIEDYLRTYAPHLLTHAETISHWAGFSSISPKVLIALMEHQTSIISRESSDGALRPFGSLSDKIGFNEQIQDIANLLADLHYNQKTNPNQLSSVVRILSTNLSPDTDSSVDLLELNREFSRTYYRLFPATSQE